MNKSMSENENSSIAEAIEEAIGFYDADIYLYSGEINHKNYGELVSQVSRHKKNKNVLLALVTNGGSANSAYQIARFLHKTWLLSSFGVVPRCHIPTC